MEITEITQKSFAYRPVPGTYEYVFQNPELRREMSRQMRTQLRNLTTHLREYNNMKVRE